QHGAGNRLKVDAGWQAVGAGADGEIFLPLLHALDGFCRVAGMQLHFDARVVLAEAAQDIVEEAVAGRDRAVQGEFSMQNQLVLLECLANGLPSAHGLARVLTELLPLASQLNRAVVAQEQRCAELIFELLDATAERGW